MYSNILVLDDGTEIQAGATGSAITSLVYTSTVSSTTDLCPGAACAGKIEFTVWVDPGASLVFTSGTRVQYYQQDDAGVRTLVGTFWAVKPTKQSRNTYKVYAYDAVSKLDGIQSTWLRSIQDSFPMSLWAFAQAVAQQCGVTLGSTALPRSGDYQVQAFYADNLTGRQLLSWVAEASCTFLRATPTGGVEFAWYEDYAATGIFPDAVEHWVALDLSGELLACADGSIWTYNQDTAAYRSGGLTYEEYSTALIDKVQISQSDDDVGVIYPPDETGTNALVIKGNLLLTAASADVLQPVAQSIFENMQQISYTPLKASLFSDGRVFSAGQIITVTDPQGNSLQSYLMTVQQQGGTISVESTGNATRTGTAAVNEGKYTNLDGKLLEIQTSIDGLSVKASTLSGDMASLELTVDGLSTQVQQNYTDIKNYVDTDAKNAAVQQAVEQASAAFDETLKLYPTTVQMTSAIQQSADAIELSVTQKLEGYVTDEDLTQYPTTVEMNSAISQSADQIELTVNQKLSGYTTSEDFTQFQQEYDSFKLQVVQDGEVRSAFAADTSSVTISSGVITFSGNTLVVESKNFNLEADGTVQITGTFTSQTDLDKTYIGSGQIHMERKTNDGNWKTTGWLYSNGQNSAFGNFQLYGQSGDGSQSPMISMGTNYSGGSLYMFRGSDKSAYMSCYPDTNGNPFFALSKPGGQASGRWQVDADGRGHLITPIIELEKIRASGVSQTCEWVYFSSLGRTVLCATN